MSLYLHVWCKKLGLWGLLRGLTWWFFDPVATNGGFSCPKEANELRRKNAEAFRKSDRPSACDRPPRNCGMVPSFLLDESWDVMRCCGRSWDVYYSKMINDILEYIDLDIDNMRYNGILCVHWNMRHTPILQSGNFDGEHDDDDQLWDIWVPCFQTTPFVFKKKHFNGSKAAELPSGKTSNLT